jgi:hypothetical protein
MRIKTDHGNIEALLKLLHSMYEEGRLVVVKLSAKLPPISWRIFLPACFALSV